MKHIKRERLLQKDHQVRKGIEKIGSFCVPAVLFCLNSSKVAALLVVYFPCEDVRTTLVVKLVGASSGAPVQGALSEKEIQCRQCIER